MQELWTVYGEALSNENYVPPQVVPTEEEEEEEFFENPEGKIFINYLLSLSFSVAANVTNELSLHGQGEEQYLLFTSVGSDGDEEEALEVFTAYKFLENTLFGVSYIVVGQDSDTAKMELDTYTQFSSTR